MEDSILNLRSKKYSINKIAKELKLSTIRVTEVLKKNIFSGTFIVDFYVIITHRHT